MLSTLRPEPMRDPADALPGVAPRTGEPVVQVTGLGKRFDIYPNDRSRFFEFLGSRTHHSEHWSVRGVDFSVGAGQAFGVVGSNGAGKSTLLRLLAGISEPSEGELVVRGRMATLLDLGVGFHAPFSGRENIELGCALAGMTPAEITARIPEIIKFAELGEFIDHPVRTYSTGMQLRLGFAIAVHSDARVLLIDEVLAVGDQYFQRKCIRRIERALGEGCALIVVSHDLHAIRALCSEVLWLEGGRPRMQGDARTVIDEYIGVDRVALAALGPTVLPPVPAAVPFTERRAGGRRATDRVDDRGALDGGGDRVGDLPRGDDRRAGGGGRPTAVDAGAAVERARGAGGGPGAPHDSAGGTPADRVTAMIQRACAVGDPAALFGRPAGEAPRVGDGDQLLVSGTGEVRILRVQLLDAQGRERERFRSGEGMVIAVTVRTTEAVEDPIFGAAIHRDDGVYVFGPNTGFDRVLRGRYHGVYTFFLDYPSLPLLHGHYRVSVAVFDAGHVRPYAWHNQMYPFSVGQDVEDHGIVAIAHTWGVVPWLEAGPTGEPEDP